MRTSLYIFLLIPVLGIFSCQKSTVHTPIELIQWVENPSNGLRNERNFANHSFILQYKPHSYIVTKEERLEMVNEDLPNKNLKALGDLEYFTLTVVNKAGKDPIKQLCRTEQEYLEVFNYYSFDLTKDLSMISGTDTLECVMAGCERSYGLAAEVKFLLAFLPGMKGTDRTVLLNDKYFGYGKLYFNFSDTAIENIPKLKSE